MRTGRVCKELQRNGCKGSDLVARFGKLILRFYADEQQVLPFAKDGYIC